jgi:hypothetical protein
MKVAVLSEWDADEAFLRIIAEALLGVAAEWHAGLERRSGGFGSVPKLLPTLLKYLHYRTDVDGVIVVVDSDETPIHTAEHETGYDQQRCRFCQLKRIAVDFESSIRPRPNGTPLRTAIGLAAPEIEAWYLCGLYGWATESMWLEALDSRRHVTYRARLKPNAYGIDRAPGGVKTTKAREHAARLAGDLERLETCFQNGFGPLAREIRSWRDR